MNDQATTKESANWLLLKNQAKADAAITETRNAVTAISRATATGIETPTPATNHTERTSCGPRRIGNSPLLFTCIIIAPSKPITAPLPNVTMHIVQSPRIGSKTVYANRVPQKTPFLVVVPGILSVIVCLCCRQVFTRVECPLASCPAGILPLRFSRKTKPFF